MADGREEREEEKKRREEEERKNQEDRLDRGRRDDGGTGAGRIINRLPGSYLLSHSMIGPQ